MVDLRLLAPHWPLLLLLAVSVATIDRVSKVYETRIKEQLENAEFGFLFLESIYFVIPLYVFRSGRRSFCSFG